MNREVSIDQLAGVARSLSWLQRIFLGCLLLGFSLAFLGTSGWSPEVFLAPMMLLAFGAGFMMLVFTYRCASGSGRSGILWVLGVMFLKLIPLIILCYLTRKWLEKQGVKMHSLGLGYTLPTEDAISEEPIGFTRF